MAATLRELRETLASYLAREMDLDSFDEWFTRATWNIHQTHDPAVRRLASAIKLRLAEHSSNHISDVRLDADLTALLGRYRARVDLDAVSSRMPETTTSTAQARIPVSIAA